MEDNENCKDLHFLLTGEFLPDWFSSLEELLQHWRHCAECQVLLPKAPTQIEYIKNAWLMQIRSTIEQLHRDFDSEKQALIEEESVRREAESKAYDELHPKKDGVIFFDIDAFRAEAQKPSPELRLHREFLDLLSEKGTVIRQQLEPMNDNAGLTYFSLVSETDSCEYGSRVCGSLIASLPKETQYFVFQAILSADITSLFGDEFPDKSEWAVHRIVERAAPGFLRDYLESEKPNLEDGATSFLDNSGHKPLLAVSERLEQFASDFTEIKAANMEMIRILEHKRHQTSEIMEDLQNRLGENLFRGLHPETVLYLERAERYFRGKAELGDVAPSIQNFQQAYECEFQQRVSRPLVQMLGQKGFNQYPTGSRIKLSQLSLGQQLPYLRADKLVREVVTDLGCDLNQIIDTASRVNSIRNKAAHGTECSDTEASLVREMVLGPRGLKALFPTR
jgi:hypothetical protein